MRALGCFLLLGIISVQGHTLPPFQQVSNGYRGTLATKAGVVTSPGYPKPYGHWLHDVVTINVPRHSNVTLKFTYFDIQSCSSCSCDSLTIDGLPGDGKLCGSSLPNRNGIFELTNYDHTSLGITFVTDGSVQGTGFYMEYTIDDPAVKTETTTSGYATTTNRIEQKTLTQLTGVVTSPGYPNNYPPNSTTIYTVYVPLRSIIEIHFKHFDLQDCYSCDCDYVHIRTFNKFCGTNMQYRDIYMSDYNLPYIEFEFHSDDHDERSGFYMTYNFYNPSSRPVQPTTLPPYGYNCPTPACDPRCPQKYSVFRTNSYGCPICECSASVTTTQSQTGSNNLLLKMLLNLGTEAEALELQAQSVKDSANLAISILQGGNGQN